MQTFVINLKRASKRREFMENQLHKLNMPYQIFEAVDGKTLKQGFINQYCHKEMMEKHADWLTLGMVGASLSHFYLYQHIVANNIAVAFILEDDIVLTSEVVNILNFIEQNETKFSKFEPILLYYASHSTLKLSNYQSIKLSNNYQALYPHNLALVGSSAAYIIFNETAKKMVDVILPIRVAPDAWTSFYGWNGLNNIRCVFPTVLKPAPFESQIGYIDNTFLGKVKNVLNLNNIYPFSAILEERRRKIATKMVDYILVNDKPISGK